MILTANVPTPPTSVVSRHRLFALLDTLRDEAAHEMSAAFDGISGKRIDAACLPGFGRHGVSRATNGSDTNPLYRIAGLLLLMRRLGMGRARALRWLEWLRQVVDTIWPPAEGEEFSSVLDLDAEIDGLDELPRQRARAGDAAAARDLLAIKTRQIAVGQEVVTAIRRELAGQG